jgi:hypothetical protein
MKNQEEFNNDIQERCKNLAALFKMNAPEVMLRNSSRMLVELLIAKYGDTIFADIQNSLGRKYRRFIKKRQS